jgi:putative transposase
MEKFICDPNSPYHVTSRCINRDWFSMSTVDVWNIFSTNLKFATHAFDLRLHAFVLMNNHFHMLVTAPTGNLSESMAYFIRESSRQITHDTQRINQTFARRFKRTRTADFHYFFNTYKYIYQNPLRAGLVRRVEEYPFSSLPGLLGLGPLVLPVEDPNLVDNTNHTLRWLNEPIQGERVRDLRRALIHRDFRPPAKSRKVSDIFSKLI